MGGRERVRKGIRRQIWAVDCGCLGRGGTRLGSTDGWAATSGWVGGLEADRVRPAREGVGGQQRWMLSQWEEDYGRPWEGERLQKSGRGWAVEGRGEKMDGQWRRLASHGWMAGG